MPAQVQLSNSLLMVRQLLSQDRNRTWADVSSGRRRSALARAYQGDGGVSEIDQRRRRVRTHPGAVELAEP